MAAPSPFTGIYPTIRECHRMSPHPCIANHLTMIIVLRFRIHVVHGRGVRAGIPGRPSQLRQRTSEWSIWTDSVHDFKLHNRPAIPL